MPTPGTATVDAVPWHLLTQRRPTPRAAAEVRPVRVYAAVVAMTLTVLLGVAVVGAYAARNEAEDESVAGAGRRTELVADAVVEPVLSDGLLTGEPGADAALDAVVRAQVLGDAVVRVKVWASDGTILYSDEPRLVGQRFALDADEQAILEAAGAPDATGAEVTDLDEPENVYERGRGKLLEVYHGMRTPGGEPVLLETYSPYDVVSARSDELWRGFGTVMVASLVALMLLMLPVLAFLLRRLRRARDEREGLLQAALHASGAERRRIAASLHDGVVQELAATSFVVAGAAHRAAEEGDPLLADQLDEAAAAVRGGISGLRSLLVDIWPASLDGTGLAQALPDLVAGLRARDVDVHLDVCGDTAATLDPERARLVFQVAQEAARNAAKHARADTVWLSLAPESGAVVLEVRDDGVGFDVEAVVSAPAQGHFGVRLLVDASRRLGAGLAVASDRHGTRWRLEVPV